MTEYKKKIVFLGCPLDCDEQFESITEKYNNILSYTLSDDPYDWIVGLIRQNVSGNSWEKVGSLDVPNWLRPQPSASEMKWLSADNFVNFIESQGCKDYAKLIQEQITQDILPNIPCLVAVDHCLIGGSLQALSNYYGRDNLTIIVLDSHIDGIPLTKTLGAIQYDIETNPNSVYDAKDHLLYDRIDSYNASSFLDQLINNGVIRPDHLYLCGVSDYPPKKAFRINDRRIVNYVSAFSELKKKGANIISKKDCQMNPNRLQILLKQIKTPYVYVSVDMDIGARAAVEGVRFRNRQGLNEQNLYKMVDHVQNILKKGVQLVGMDVTEFNARIAGANFHLGERVYPLAANIIQKLLFN